jgi:hypothetical protein
VVAVPGLRRDDHQATGMMQEERRAPQRTEYRPDQPQGIAATDEVPGENLGTHSLLAKDSTTSDPFRELGNG